MTWAPDSPGATAVMSLGSVSVGAVVSTTPTSKEPVAVLPALSVALHDTVVVPSGNVPGTGLQVGVSAPSIASVAVAVHVTALRPARWPRR